MAMPRVALSHPVYLCCCHVFFFNDTATTEIYTLSLHDALPICMLACYLVWHLRRAWAPQVPDQVDRKSTRLNSSHLGISYAVFCLKTKHTTLHAGRPERLPGLLRPLCCSGHAV